MTRRIPQEILNTYPARLLELLCRGEDDGWVDSKEIKALRIHAGDLIRMMTDMRLHQLPQGHPGLWAPIHALRALAHLEVPTAVGRALQMLEPLTALGRREFLFEVSWFGLMGLAIVPDVEAYLANSSNAVECRMWAAEMISVMTSEIGGPGDKPAIALYRRLLALPGSMPEELRAHLTDRLADLQDPMRGLDPDCPLCRMMVEGLPKD